VASCKRWIVTTSPKRPIGDVKKKLTKAGFSVDQVLGEIGSITGTASDDVVKRVRSLDGVVDVSPDHEIDIGPPDEPVTW
jgi:hypothetical protein